MNTEAPNHSPCNPACAENGLTVSCERLCGAVPRLHRSKKAPAKEPSWELEPIQYIDSDRVGRARAAEFQWRTDMSEPKTPTPDDERFAKSVTDSIKHQANMEAPKMDPWQLAIDDELVTCHLGTTDGGYTDPREALKAIIDWHVQVALDPTVSKEAAQLIAGTQESNYQGWKEATIAWSVCQSIHASMVGPKKDDLYTTRQADFTRHWQEARAKALQIKKEQGQ